MSAPRRLLEGGGVVPPELMRALSGAPGEPSAKELTELAGALESTLGVALPVPMAAKALQAGTTATLSGGAKVGVSAAKPLGLLGAWMVGGLALGAGLSGLVYSFTGTDDPAPRARATPSVTASARRTAVPNPVPPLPAAPASGELAPSIDVRALPLSGRSAPQAASQPAPAARPESEISLLKRAREATRQSPARALAITSQHAQLYPSGALAQEREVIAIDALLALGRQAEAAQRAQQFQEQYPGSAHARRMGALFTGGSR